MGGATSAVPDFIAGVMPGVPMDKASEALQKGCERVFDDLNVDAMPRNWLRVLAVREGAPVLPSASRGS